LAPDPRSRNSIAKSFTGALSRFGGFFLPILRRRRRLETTQELRRDLCDLVDSRLEHRVIRFEGVLKPLIFLTNCSDAARISASVTGGSKLNNVLMFRHIPFDLHQQRPFSRQAEFSCIHPLSPGFTHRFHGLHSYDEEAGPLRTSLLNFGT